MAGNEGGIVIQDRDRHLLEELATLRVVDREQAKIVGPFGSTTRVNARLLALTRAGLLRRFFLGTTGPGTKALYALSVKGAKLIGVPLRGPRRRQDETLVADFFIEHQLTINEMYCALSRGRQEQHFFGNAQDRFFLASFPFKPNTCNGVRGDEAFIHCPIEQMAQAFNVAIDRCLGDRLTAVTFGTILPDGRFVDLADLMAGEVWQQNFEPVTVPFLRTSLVQKPSREFGKRHIGLELRCEHRLETQFVPVLLIDLVSQTPVAGFR